MKDTQQPRGIRNNNPLNIRHSADRWKGMRTKQTDPAFVQFTSMAMGYRAAWRVLNSYHRRFLREQRPFTPRNVIYRWAPPAENDSQAYLRTVCLLTGLGGNEGLPWPQETGILYNQDTDEREAPARLVLLLKGMTCVECGIGMSSICEQEIRRGYKMAFQKKSSRTSPTQGKPMVSTRQRK
ncbi:MAG: hypothetical protein IJC23_04395 [Bacteroidaceae bacterium]|nr:hypothetical protein [Bacteroidaceae bacterium]